MATICQYSMCHLLLRSISFLSHLLLYGRQSRWITQIWLGWHLFNDNGLVHSSVLLWTLLWSKLVVGQILLGLSIHLLHLGPRLNTLQGLLWQTVSKYQEKILTRKLHICWLVLCASLYSYGLHKQWWSSFPVCYLAMAHWRYILLGRWVTVRS